MLRRPRDHISLGALALAAPTPLLSLPGPWSCQHSIPPDWSTHRPALDPRPPPFAPPSPYPANRVAPRHTRSTYGDRGRRLAVAARSHWRPSFPIRPRPKPRPSPRSGSGPPRGLYTRPPTITPSPLGPGGPEAPWHQSDAPGPSFPPPCAEQSFAKGVFFPSKGGGDHFSSHAYPSFSRAPEHPRVP